MTGTTLNLHASCILLGEAGLLIRGPSGSGKSALARDLVAVRRARGGFAALVADDRVLVRRRHGRLIAQPHPALAGQIEHRGFGLREIEHEAAAVLRLVLDLGEAAPRLPEAEDRETTILGVCLPRVAGRAADAAALIEAAWPWPR